MKRRSSLGFLVLIGAIVVAVGAGMLSQWRQTLALRGELELARATMTELGRLREENQRLRARQIPTAELDRLRADHAALPRLRRELETLGKSAESAR
jgi:Tfp pilus assembly protein PilN